MTVLPFPFQFWCFLFFFSCLIALAKTCSTMLNEWQEWATLSCSWCYRDNFQFFTIECNTSCEFVICGVYLLRYIPSICILLRVFFVINGCAIMLSASPAFIEMIVWFLSFLLLMWYIMLITLQMLNHSFHSWSWCVILLIYYWSLVASILLSIFANVFICDIGL